MEIWGLPFSTFLGFIILLTTILISIVWSIVTKRDDEDKELEGEE